MKIKQLFYNHFWFDLYYKVKCFFKPKQEWLTDVIPDTHCDKVELIPRLLFKCLEHYVEVERKVEWVHDLGYDWAEEVEQRFTKRFLKHIIGLRLGVLRYMNRLIMHIHHIHRSKRCLTRVKR